MKEFLVLRAYRVGLSNIVGVLKNKELLIELLNGIENDNLVRKLKIQNHTIIIDGREIELSEESYKKLKESLV